MMSISSLLGIARDRRGPYIGKAEDEKNMKKLEDIIDIMSNKELAEKSEHKQDCSEQLEPEYKQPDPEYKQPEPEYKQLEPEYKQPEPEYKEPEPEYKQHEAEYQSVDASLQTEAKAPTEAAKSVEPSEPSVVKIVNSDQLTWAERVWCTIPVEPKQPIKYTEPTEATLPKQPSEAAESRKIVESLINSILDSVIKEPDESGREISKADKSGWRLPKQSKWKKSKGKGVSSKEVDKSLPKTDIKESHKGVKPACPKQDMPTPSSELKVVGCMVPSTPSKKIHDWDKFRRKELTKGSSSQAEILHFKKYGPSIKLNEKKKVHWEKFNKKGLTKGSSKELRSVEIHHLRKYGLSIKGLAEYKDMDSGNKLDDDIALTKLMELMKLIDQLEGMNEDKAKSNKSTKRSKKSRQAKQSVPTETVNSIIESILDSVINIMEPADTVSESTNKLPRMRGGALEDEIEQRKETATYLASIAILSAKYAGYEIELKHMLPNNANGDCAFESCIDQVNTTREKVFEHFGARKFKDHLSLRKAVIDNLKINSNAMEWFNGSQDEYKKELDKLHKVGTWTPAIADFVMPGIAFTLKKNILIYKTRRFMGKAPIFVVSASQLGGEADTDIPIVLCYSENHYEGLVPVDETNTMWTIQLVQWYLKGTYNITYDDIPVFQDALSVAKSKTNTDALEGPSGTKRKATQPPTPKKKSITPEKAFITPTKTPAVKDVQKSPGQSAGKTKEQQRRATATEHEKASPMPKKTSTAETVPKSPSQSPRKIKEQLRKAAATERVRQHRLNRGAAKSQEERDKNAERIKEIRS
nr:hypothetical protein [Alteromonas macleodii]